MIGPDPRSRPIRLAGWSGPRNISTALMRAWENRPGTVVVDEPFYAAYLQRTGLDHPGRDEVLASQPTDPDVVVTGLLAPLAPHVELHYAKQMAHHLAPDADLGWTLGCANLVLIRDPEEVVASYVASREACEVDDVGVRQQQRLVAFWDAHDCAPPVVDAGDFLRDPEGYLRAICTWAGVDFSPRMLSWPAGPRESDGVWAPYWYDAVHRSTGFTPWRPREVHLDAHNAAVARACRPAYDELHARRLRVG